MRKRESNIELLRILSMFLIVCHHYAVHGKFVFEGLSFNKIIVQFLSYGGKLGVNLFVLISGYFLVSTGFKGKKAVKLWIDATIYSVIITGIFLLCGEDVGIKGLIEGVLPIPYNVWWFITSYFVLFILSGYLNAFINALPKTHLDKLIIILIVICSILPTFFKAEMASSNLMWFVLLYLIAARMHLYPLKKKIFDYSLTVGVIIYALCLASCVIFDIIGQKILFFGNHATYFSGMEKITMLSCSVFIFNGFKNIHIKSSKCINTLATTTLGIYLIHDNGYIRKFLWINLFKNAEYSYSSMLILHAVVAIIATFSVCSFISFIYNISLGKLVGNMLNRYYANLECCAIKFIHKIASTTDKIIQ